MMYANYGRYSVQYDECQHDFQCLDDKRGTFIRAGRVSVRTPGAGAVNLGDYREVSGSAVDFIESRRLSIHYSAEPDTLPDLTIEFLIDRSSVRVKTWSSRDADLAIEGDLLWGAEPVESTFAVCLGNSESKGLRTAHGPAASKLDHALYDRLADCVLDLGPGGGVRLDFDWRGGNYRFTGASLALQIIDDYYTVTFAVPHQAIRRSHQFATPPVGWMTWYSVKFGASQEAVLANARWLAGNLKDYGANCIWVDWEWYHSDFSGTEPSGANTFSPSKLRYPEGLRHVSDEVRELGLVPALWIGPTNDTNLNPLLEANPDWVLAHKPEWCGQWWIDPSHPGVVGEYIPAVFRQLLDWGYEAFKWDCLPASMGVFDHYHERFYDTSLSTEQAFRQLVRAARDVIGEGRYMMSCCGTYGRGIVFAADHFDGARIGGDIFRWEEFLDQCVDRVLRFYRFHNVLWYADADNVVVRDEFNTMDQARSRVSFYGLTGVPITLGDDLPNLPEPRVELLRRAMPVVGMHPMDIGVGVPSRSAALAVVNLNVATAFGSWNVVDVMNTTDGDVTAQLDLGGDLGLDTAEGQTYAIYDFWNQEFLGARSTSLDLGLQPHASRVIRVTRLVGHPQVMSTSRHITQGAYDLERLDWDGAGGVLSGASRVVGSEPYRVTLYVPKGYEPIRVEALRRDSADSRTWVLTLMSGGTQVLEWAVAFRAL